MGEGIGGIEAVGSTVTMESRMPALQRLSLRDTPPMGKINRCRTFISPKQARQALLPHNVPNQASGRGFQLASLPGLSARFVTAPHEELTEIEQQRLA